MFKIKDNTIELTRGDEVTMFLTIDNYIFKPDDKIEFRVYKRRGMNELPLLSKTILVEEETERVAIELTSELTKFGEMSNKAIIYWYEVELNDATTVIGYDGDGAKELILYPEGAEEDPIEEEPNDEQDTDEGTDEDE